MMKISKSQLIEFGACDDGLGRFIRQTDNTDKEVEIISLIGGYNTYSDLLWLADKILDKEKIVEFACNCALLNIELVKPYSSRYDLIVEFLNNPIADDYARVVDAADAADAAYAAVYAVDAVAAVDDDYARVVDAADAAAAVYAAVYAVDAVAAVAAAAAAAVYAAVDGKSKNKINDLLIKLFS